MGKIVDTLSWCWYTKLKKIYLVSLFILFTTLSIGVLLGEISIFTNVDLNIFAHMLKDDYGFLRVQVICFLTVNKIDFSLNPIDVYLLLHILWSFPYQVGWPLRVLPSPSH